MINVRRNLFETNSSSCHVLTISDRCKYVVEEPNLYKYVKDNTLILDFLSINKYDEDDDIALVCSNQYERLMYCIQYYLEMIANYCDYKTDEEMIKNINIEYNKGAYTGNEKYKKILFDILDRAKMYTNAEKIKLNCEGFHFYCGEDGQYILDDFDNPFDFILCNYIVFEKSW